MTVHRHAVALAVFASSLCIASQSHAAIFKVGAGGYPTIAAALDAVAYQSTLSSSPNELRIAAGSYEGSPASRTISVPLAVSGGWNADFTMQSADPTLTRVSGAYAHSAMGYWVFTSGGSSISNLTVESGYLSTCASSGAGAAFALRGSARLTVSKVSFSKNMIYGGTGAFGPCYGAGLWVYATDTSKITLQAVTFEGNADYAGTPDGSGLWLLANGQAYASMQGIRSTGNWASTTSNSYAGASVALFAIGANSLIEFSNGQFTNNASYGGTGGGGISNLEAQAESGSMIWLDRLSVTGGYSTGAFVHPMSVSPPVSMPHTSVALNALNTGLVRLRNSVVSGSNGLGLGVIAADSGVVQLDNLTVADHRAAGLVNWSASSNPVQIANSIFAGNGLGVVSSDYTPADPGTTRYPGWLQQNVVLMGSRWDWSNLNNPARYATFADPDHGNYHLPGASPARNHGNNAPSIDLGVADLDGNARVQESTVDIGAYEYPVFSFIPVYPF